ncbi:CGLAU_01105 family protein [Corynebacterium gallinarum]|uniref:Uncharacterized protein n=1 Tax=Corynebacterium gallinarum TaxID=2762214 RepID=A0A8I0HLW4_9CORY|nr:CGLAU_01105 family protein [Corynebacterium gallinarum]MBD8029622.1 hypothetical protein [Corynebacterium gallinarum]
MSDKDSVLGNLGDLTGQVVKKVREDVASDGRLDKLKKEASEAVETAKGGDYLGAGKDFAKDAGEFIKEVAGSVKAAVGEAKDTDEASAVKSRLASVVESSRDKLDDTVDKVRSKKAAAGDAEETAESTNDAGDDIIDGEVVTNPDDPHTPSA